MCELLAILLFVTEYYNYLWAKEFILGTDHASLCFLENFNQPVGMLFRWLQKLAAYKYKVIHRKGHLHSNCDSLSRIRHSTLKRLKRICKREDCPDCTLETESCICIASEIVGVSQKSFQTSVKFALLEMKIVNAMLI